MHTHPDANTRQSQPRQGMSIWLRRGALLASAFVFLSLPSPLHATWVLTGSMNVARSSHSATLLQDGRVLVYGGYVDSQPTFTAELFNPATGTWTPTGGTFYARGAHQATLLPSGLVLVTGSAGKPEEMYNPATQGWYSVPPMLTPRTSHTATLLPDGRVLVAGGYNGTQHGNGLVECEIYDPATFTWTRTGSLSLGRFSHQATLLANGKVLVAGGFGPDLDVAFSAELFDPATGRWTRASGLFHSRGGMMFQLTSLNNGQAVLTGGLINDGSRRSLPSVEVYNPGTDGWYSAANLVYPCRYHAAARMLDGKVIITGGWDADREHPRIILKRSQTFNPNTLVWSVTQDMNHARAFHTLTVLKDGRVLAAGGDDALSYSHSLASAELLDPASTNPRTWPRPRPGGPVFTQD